MPEGSDVSLRVTGGSGDETLVFADRAGAMRDIEPEGGKADRGMAAPTQRATVRQFAGKLTADGTLTLKSGEQDLSAGRSRSIPDKPPVIRFADEPKRAVNGALELNYEIDDDYGAASAKADFALADAAAAAMRAALRRAGNAAVAAAPRRQGERRQDHARPDRACLGRRQHQADAVAADDAGQEARSETKTIVLPERPFTNPLARAVVEQRKHPGARRQRQARRARPDRRDHAAARRHVRQLPRTISAS